MTNATSLADLPFATAMPSWTPDDILARFSDELELARIAELRQEREPLLHRPHFQALFDALSRFEVELPERLSVDYSSPHVTIGEAGQLSPEQHDRLLAVLEALIPWRKGPFRLFGTEVDAEWRSDLKWARIEPHLESLSGKRVADIGCGNGYYMFRMAAHAPEFVLGFDPSAHFAHTFTFLQSLIRDERLQYELLGVEHAALFPEFFDTIFCLGVLYHQRDPFSALRQIREALRPGGQLVVESQCIPGDESVALFPAERYAKARNVYFVPTPNCLAAWVERAGFVDIEMVSTVKTTTEEQRQTDYCRWESLEHFLDPEDPSLTVEGYPAPWRAVVIARKKH